MQVKDNTLWFDGLSATELVQRFGSPLYVYEEAIIHRQIHTLRAAIPCPDTHILYAAKANSNLALLRLIHAAGCHLDAVSGGEIFLGRRAGFNPQEILFTGNNVSEEEMAYAVEQGVLVNIDALSQLQRYGRCYPNTMVSLRINPDIGQGHHDHCITGGPHSKFGIYYDKLDQACVIACQYGLKTVGLHQHIGSGILNPAPFLHAMEVLLEAARLFKDLTFIDLGGGLGIPYSPEEQPLDLDQLGAQIVARFDSFCRSYGRPLTLKVESGRYLMAQAGTLLTRCTTCKETPKHCFVGTDAGLNHLLRPALYGAYHRIVNASHVKGQKQLYTVCGNICENSDLFARQRPISRIQEGDLVAILDVGAYGYSMSSNYNSRPRPAEVLIRNGEAHLIRRRETLQDLLQGYSEAIINYQLALPNPP